jgi:hypothetical protein
MTNLLKKGVEFLANALKANASDDVTYARGSNSVELKATLGKTPIQVQSDSGVQVAGEIIDFVFLAEDLILNGSLTVPQHGDKITTDRAIYEVNHLGVESCWKYCDPYGKNIRLHCKQVGSLEA